MNMHGGTPGHKRSPPLQTLIHWQPMPGGGQSALNPCPFWLCGVSGCLELSFPGFGQRKLSARSTNCHQQQPARKPCVGQHNRLSKLPNASLQSLARHTRFECSDNSKWRATCILAGTASTYRAHMMSFKTSIARSTFRRQLCVLQQVARLRAARGFSEAQLPT